MVHSEIKGAILELHTEVEYRVNNPKDWYDRLAQDDSASAVKQYRKAEERVNDLVWSKPLSDRLDPRYLPWTSVKSASKHRNSFKIADQGLPILASNYCEVFLNDHLDSDPSFETILGVDADFSSTTTIIPGSSIEFDLGDALLSPLLIGSQITRRSAYGFGASALFVGAIRPLIKDKWKVKISYEFKHDTVPSDQYDGFSAVFNVRLYGFSLSQYIYNPEIPRVLSDYIRPLGVERSSPIPLKEQSPDSDWVLVGI